MPAILSPMVFDIVWQPREAGLEEDDNRLKDCAAAENQGMLRRVAVFLLRQDHSKGSVSGMLLRAAWDDEFRRPFHHLLADESALTVSRRLIPSLLT